MYQIALKVYIQWVMVADGYLRLKGPENHQMSHGDHTNKICTDIPFTTTLSTHQEIWPSILVSNFRLLSVLKIEWILKHCIHIALILRISDPRGWILSSRWRHNGRDSVLITSLTIVYSTVYSDADQRQHQSSASLAFVWGIHRGPVNSPHKWPVTRKIFPFDDVIMVMR